MSLITNIKTNLQQEEEHNTYILAILINVVMGQHSGLSKYHKDTQTTQRHAKTGKDGQRRAKTHKDTQRQLKNV